MSVKTIIELKQHSPILHFQSHENGCSLRASEVKPKLDRFLLRRKGGFDVVAEETPDWIVGYNKKVDVNTLHPALNYKMRFSYKEKPLVIVPPERGIYYGNMGDNSNRAKCVLGDICCMEIICFNQDLKNFILKNIRDFFIVTNFGRMQSKGFGSFTVSSIDGAPQESLKTEMISDILCTEYGASACYRFYYNEMQDWECGYVRNQFNKPGPRRDACIAAGVTRDNIHLFKEETFGKIKTLYSVMKSGYNINGNYHRSFLFEYFHEVCHTGNEKAYMKKKKISPWETDPFDGTKRPVQHPESDRKPPYEKSEPDDSYVRSVLGLAEKIEYIKKFTVNKKGNYVGSEKEKITIEHCVEDKNDKIERFPSPILFKIIGDMVYFVGKRVDKIIFNKTFTFSNESGESEPLSTPDSFDIDGFLDYFYRNYDTKAKGYGIWCRIDVYNKEVN